MTSTLMSAQGKIELTLEEAEKIKKEIGIPAVEDDKTIDGKILPSQVLSLVRPCVEQLASEIERSFDFFREESHGGKVDKVILFGGGANLKGLTKSLYDALEIEAVIGDSLEDIKTLTANDKSGDQAGSQFDLAIGAVLNRSDKINLLPVEVKEKTRRFVEKVSFKAVVAGIAMTLLLTYIGLNIQVASQNKELNALKLEQRTLAPQLEALRSVIISGRIFKNHPYWEDVLREISNTVQPKMFLTDLSMKNDRINIKGIIMQGDQGGQAVLSNFMITLEEGMFRDVNLVMTKRGPEGEPDLNFEIEADID
jgi:Tfp pilus assembly protein PilN